MNLETVTQNYQQLDEKARQAFQNLYWFLLQIHEVKRAKGVCKSTSIVIGLLAFFFSRPFLFSYGLGMGNPTERPAAFLGYLLGVLAVSYLIGWLIGLLRYHGDKSIGSLRYRFLHAYQHTEKVPLTKALQFIEACQPVLVNDTDREVRKHIKVLNSGPNPFQTA